MGKPPLSKAEMQYKTTLMVKVIEASVAIVKVAIWGLVLIFWAHYANESIKALSGKVTMAKFAEKLLASVAINQWVAWVIAGLSTSWAILERGQKRKKIAELSGRPIELEKLIDPGRSSSLITPRGTTKPGDLRWTPSFRPRSAENKIDSGGPLSFVFLFVCCSFRASKPFRKERTSRAWHRPSSLSVFLGFPTLPPQAV